MPACHTVKLMAPNLVAPYCMSGKRAKNDAADAAACADVRSLDISSGCLAKYTEQAKLPAVEDYCTVQLGLAGKRSVFATRSIVPMQSTGRT